MIDPIIWTTKIATGIAWQDFQHKELLGIINTLREQVSAESIIDDSSKKLIDFLIFYTGDHFGVEEKYMDLLKYPDAENHKDQHIVFLKKVEEMKNLSSFSITIKTEELLKELARWFYGHIHNTDQQFGAFLKDNGIR